MTKLMARARFLGKRLDTEWAWDNANKYDEFADEIERLYTEKKLTAHDFNELALTAFYDYELKEE